MRGLLGLITPMALSLLVESAPHRAAPSSHALAAAKAIDDLDHRDDSHRDRQTDQYCIDWSHKALLPVAWADCSLIRRTPLLRLSAALARALRFGLLEAPVVATQLVYTIRP